MIPQETTPATLTRMQSCHKSSLAAAFSWVRYWFPLRHGHPAGKQTCRNFMQNAKIARWLLGGRYPSRQELL
jgi:hypothetical protein